MVSGKILSMFATTAGGQEGVELLLRPDISAPDSSNNMLALKRFSQSTINGHRDLIIKL